MKYEVCINRIAYASFVVEADNEKEAERKALREAKGSYDFNNDGFPSYEVSEVIEVPERFVWED